MRIRLDVYNFFKCTSAWTAIIPSTVCTLLNQGLVIIWSGPAFCSEKYVPHNVSAMDNYSVEVESHTIPSSFRLNKSWRLSYLTYTEI